MCLHFHFYFADHDVFTTDNNLFIQILQISFLEA